MVEETKNNLMLNSGEKKYYNSCVVRKKNSKDMLTSGPILAFPDMTKPFILTCDASGSALSYNLSQKGDE